MQPPLEEEEKWARTRLHEEEEKWARRPLYEEEGLLSLFFCIYCHCHCHRWWCCCCWHCWCSLRISAAAAFSCSSWFFYPFWVSCVSSSYLLRCPFPHCQFPSTASSFSVFFFFFSASIFFFTASAFFCSSVIFSFSPATTSWKLKYSINKYTCKKLRRPTTNKTGDNEQETTKRGKRKKRRQNKADQATTYEDRLKELGLTTLEERRHQADMVQTYKIATGKDMVNSETWFTSVTESGRPTRSAADPLNLRLEIRRQFFSQRVVESWNKIPASLKQEKNGVFQSGSTGAMQTQPSSIQVSKIVPKTKMNKSYQRRNPICWRSRRGRIASCLVHITLNNANKILCTYCNEQIHDHFQCCWS